jgi:hypothetical protein
METGTSVRCNNCSETFVHSGENIEVAQDRRRVHVSCRNKLNKHNINSVALSPQANYTD